MMKNRIDKKLFGILVGYMALYHVVYVSRRVVLKFMNEPGYVDLDWLRIIFGPIVLNFIIIPPLLLMILLITKKIIAHNLSWFSNLSIHFVFSLVYTLLVISLNNIFNHIVLGQSLELFNRAAFVTFLYASTFNFLAYGGFVAIIYAYYYVQKISKNEVQKAQLAAQLQKVKMQALKSQLNPHFLFNTLNSISSLIEEDRHKAQHMIGNLGDLLREVLLVKDQNMVLVHKEMLLLNKYIEIMQTRFSDHLSVSLEIDEEVQEALIPSMILQPIMENSFEHGYSYDATTLKVSLSITKSEHWLYIEIQNNGAALAESKGDSGLGIRNVKERLDTLFEGNFHFSMSNLEHEMGVVTRIKIPLIF